MFQHDVAVIVHVCNFNAPMNIITGLNAIFYSDVTTAKHLELLSNIRDPTSSHSLFGVLNYTKTPAGGVYTYCRRCTTNAYMHVIVMLCCHLVCCVYVVECERVEFRMREYYMHHEHTCAS